MELAGVELGLKGAEWFLGTIAELLNAISYEARVQAATEQFQLSHPGERSLKLGLKSKVST